MVTVEEDSSSSSGGAEAVVHVSEPSTPPTRSATLAREDLSPRTLQHVLGMIRDVVQKGNILVDEDSPKDLKMRVIEILDHITDRPSQTSESAASSHPDETPTAAELVQELRSIVYKALENLKSTRKVSSDSDQVLSTTQDLANAAVSLIEASSLNQDISEPKTNFFEAVAEYHFATAAGQREELGGKTLEEAHATLEPELRERREELGVYINKNLALGTKLIAEQAHTQSLMASNIALKEELTRKENFRSRLLDRTYEAERKLLVFEKAVADDCKELWTVQRDNDDLRENLKRSQQARTSLKSHNTALTRKIRQLATTHQEHLRAELTRTEAQLAEETRRRLQTSQHLDGEQAQWARDEAQQARYETQQARSEAQKARSDAEQARSEAQLARAQASQARQQLQQAREDARDHRNSRNNTMDDASYAMSQAVSSLQKSTSTLKRYSSVDPAFAGAVSAILDLTRQLQSQSARIKNSGFLWENTCAHS